MDKGYQPRAGFRWFQLLLIALPVSLAATAYLWTLGSVVVYDQQDSVRSVMLRNGGSQLEVDRMIGGFYASTAKIEGEAVVVCRDGAELSFGYITGTIHHWRTIRASDCAAAKEPARE